MNRRLLLGGALTLLLTALVVFVGGDTVGIARLGPSLRSVVVGVACAAALAATTTGLVVGMGESRPSALRAALAAAWIAASVVVIGASSALPWVSIGPFGAGPLGELALLVLPLAVMLGFACGNGLVGRR